MRSSQQQLFLESLGWNKRLEDEWQSLNAIDLVPARVIGQEKTFFRILFAPDTSMPASLLGKIRHEQGAADLPAVGDWVACQINPAIAEARIQHVLPRQSLLLRQRPGNQPIVQLIAANLDFIFITCSLNEDFDVKRIERYYKAAEESGATPVLLLTKVDLVKNPESYVELAKKEMPKLEIFLISKDDSRSMDVLQKYFSMGQTSVIVGSSGVGKSSLVNYLLGSELQKTQDVSNDSKGRHTTTSRNLLFTRWGGLIIDTPGMRDMLIEVEEEPVNDFSDVEELILKCRFSDCQHKTEPGCAVNGALKDQTLSTERWQKYQTFLIGPGRGAKKYAKKPSFGKRRLHDLSLRKPTRIL